MFVNKEELLRLIQSHQAYATSYLGKGEATHSYYAGAVSAYGNVKAWIESVETIDALKAKKGSIA